MTQNGGKFIDNSKHFGPDDEQEHNVSTESTGNTEREGYSDSDMEKSEQNETKQQQTDSRENDKTSQKRRSQKKRYKDKCKVLEMEKESLEKELEAVKRDKADRAPCDCVAGSRSLQDEVNELNAQLEKVKSNYSKRKEMMSQKKQTAKQKQKDLHKEIDNQKMETEKLSKEISEWKNDVAKLSQEKTEYEMKLTEKEQEVKSVEEAYKIEKDQFEKRIQKKDKKIHCLNSNRDKNESLLEEQRGKIGLLESCMKKLQQTNNVLRNTNANQSETIKTLHEEKESLYQEKKKLLLRLSKCAGDNLTYQNPDIADLSDEKRPTKLAEEFAELYDNEWTDAFESVNIESDQGKTTFMLQLLKRANELCHEISENHAESIKNSFSSITVKSRVPSERTPLGHLNGRRSLNTELNPGTSSNTEQEVSQESRINTNNENSNGNNENEDANADTDSTNTFSETDLDQVPHSEAKEEGIIPGTNKSEDNIASNFETDHDRNEDEEPKQKKLKLESDFELLQKEQKKPIMEARKFFEVKLSEKVEQAGSDIIVQELGIDQEEQGTVVSYVQKCMNICWSMCRHEPPVYVEFIDVEDDIPFDTNKYKPYTKSGKRLDYIVWPAVYLHKKGPMLAKGVAQGKP